MEPENRDQNYDDIIHLPHHQSAARPRMSISDRAAQFSPFAALNGYGGTIAETGRLTEQKVWLSEDRIEELNETMRFLEELMPESPPVSVTFFVPDGKKEGGAYVTRTGVIRKIDFSGRTLILSDRTEISMENVADIEICGAGLPDERA